MGRTAAVIPNRAVGNRPANHPSVVIDSIAPPPTRKVGGQQVAVSEPERVDTSVDRAGGNSFNGRLRRSER